MGWEVLCDSSGATLREESRLGGSLILRAETAAWQKKGDISTPVSAFGDMPEIHAPYLVLYFLITFYSGI